MAIKLLNLHAAHFKALMLTTDMINEFTGNYYSNLEQNADMACFLGYIVQFVFLAQNEAKEID